MKFAILNQFYEESLKTDFKMRILEKMPNSPKRIEKIFVPLIRTLSFFQN